MTTWNEMYLIAIYCPLRFYHDITRRNMLECNRAIKNTVRCIAWNYITLKFNDTLEHSILHDREIERNMQIITLHCSANKVHIIHPYIAIQYIRE